MSEINGLNPVSNELQLEQQKRAEQQEEAQETQSTETNKSSQEAASERELNPGANSFYRPSLNLKNSDLSPEQMFDKLMSNKANQSDTSAFTGAKNASGKLTPGEYKDGLTADLKTPGEHATFRKGNNGNPDTVEHCGENGCFANNNWSEAPESHKNALQLAHENGGTSPESASKSHAETIQEFRVNNFGAKFNENPAYAQAKEDMAKLSGGDDATKAALREVMSTGTLSESSKARVNDSYKETNTQISELKNSISTAQGEQKTELETDLSKLEASQAARKNLVDLSKKYAKDPEGNVVRSMGNAKVLKLKTGETGSYQARKFIADAKETTEVKAPELVEEKAEPKANFMEEAIKDFGVDGNFKDDFREKGGIFVFSREDCKFCDEQQFQVFGSRHSPNKLAYIEGETPYIVKKFGDQEGKDLQVKYGNEGRGIFPYSIKINPQGEVTGFRAGYADMPLIKSLAKE